MVDFEADDLHITCKRCGGFAAYHVPYKLVRSAQGIDPAIVHPFGGDWLIERFPQIMSWVKGQTAYRPHERGVVVCEACHAMYAADLHLPLDLYYRWWIRGKLLYARHRAHAVDLLAYIESADRDPMKYASWYWLRRVPGHFLSAKVRDRVAKKIRDSLKQG